MGMMRSGTTLLAEMIHKGGTPMFAGDADPRYDGGLKYERVSTHQINLSIVGLSRNREGIKMVDLPICQPPSTAQIAELAGEVGEASWGFKDPRTTLTYPVWCEIFPAGPRLYTYRNHEEVLRYYFKGDKSLASRFRRMRRAAVAWTHFNERVLQNIESDRAAKRPFALVSYEELIEQPELIALVEDALEVPLFDARNPDLRRNKAGDGGQSRIYQLATVGLTKRIAEVYRQLHASRLTAEAPTAA